MISVITLSDGERNRRYIIQDWIGSQGKIWRKRAKSAQTASSNWHCACFTGRWPALTGTAVWNNCCTRGVNRDLYLEGQLFHTSQQSSHSSALSNMSPGAWTNLQSAIPFPDWAIAPVAVFWQSRKESGLPDSWLFSQLGCSTCPYTFFFFNQTTAVFPAPHFAVQISVQWMSWTLWGWASGRKWTSPVDQLQIKER